MKSLFDHAYLTLLVRCIVGLVFVVASADKIADPAAFAASIDNYRIVPPVLSLLMASVLPWVELLCGLAILFGIFQKGSALLLSSLVVVFTAAVVSALARGLDISCGCFTQDPTAGKLGWDKVLENTLLFLATSFLFFSTSVKFSLESHLITKHLSSGDSP